MADLKRWNGEDWVLAVANAPAPVDAPEVDLSGLVTLDTTQTITGEKTFNDLNIVRNGETLAAVVTDGAPVKLSVSPSTDAPVNPSVDDIWIVTDVGTGTAAASSGYSTAEIDYAERAVVHDVIVGTTYNDIEGLFVVVPPQTDPYYLEFGGTASFQTGTAASGSLVTAFFQIVDADSGQSWAYNAVSAVAPSVASSNLQFPVSAHRRIMPHTTTRTFKVQSRTAAATLPAGWTNVQLLGADVPTQGFWPPSYLKAVRA